MHARGRACPAPATSRRLACEEGVAEVGGSAAVAWFKLPERRHRDQSLAAWVPGLLLGGVNKIGR